MGNFVKSNGDVVQKFIEHIVQRARAKFGVPAIAVSLINSNKLYVSDLQGVRISGTNNSATLDDFFHIGSCSKSVLATVAGKIIEEGLINWNTAFFDIFPELKKIANENYHDINLENLFLCEAGIMPFTSGDEILPNVVNSDNERLEFIKYLIQQVPVSKKNKNGKFKHLYSNASYTMASAMLEKVSGKSYEELMEHYITEQMGIDLYIGWPNRYNREQPWGHFVKGKRVEQFPPESKYEISRLLKPAGDLSISPPVFAEYIRSHLKGLRGEDNFLKSTTYRKIHFGQSGFSLGVVNGKWGGHIYSGMDGTAGTFYCRAIIVPECDFAFTIMMNAGSGSARMDAVNWLTHKIANNHFKSWWRFWA